MQFAIIIQARLGSKRLPGKVLKNFKGYSLLSVLISRLQKSKIIKNIIITTTKNNKDTKIVNFCKKNSLKFYRGDEKDVLGRYYKTATKYKVKNIVRITSDCPFIDINILDKMILYFKKNKLDYYANTYPEPSTFPDGMDIEIFKYKTLKISNKFAKNKSEREHVTVFMRHFKKFKSKRYDQKIDLSKYRLTIDFLEDFKLFTKIIDHFGKKIIFTSMKDLIKFLSKNKKLINYQKKLIRNQSFYSDILKDHLID
jgi:spore coat polysaccharide biosynthesis protein SpsF (cytidylyltransferase family)